MQRVGIITVPFWSREKPIEISPSENITIDGFYELLYDYMKPSIEAADAGHDFDWGRLKQASVKFERYLNRDLPKYILAMFAFALCDEYKNVHNVGVELWLDYFITEGLLWIDYPNFTPYEARYCNDFDEYQSFQVPRFMSSRYNSPVTRWAADPLLRAYFTGDLLATKILIKYGFVFYLPTISQYEYTLAEIILQYLGKFRLWRMDLEFEDFITLKREVEKHYPSKYEKRRVFFVIRAIYVLAELMKGNPRYLALVEPLKLMFKTTPEPHVTLDEIRKILNIATKQRKPQLVEFLCNRYAECFRESQLPLQPRSLKHLSRWRVRECLRGVRRLPHGVWSLDIPQALKRYVLIEEDNRTNHLCYFDNGKVPEYTLEIYVRQVQTIFPRIPPNGI